MEEKFYKIKFPLNAEDWHGRAKEELWAAKLTANEDDSLFCIRSTPFFTTFVSKMDIVRAEICDENSVFEFAGLERKGGHSSYMILAEPDQGKFDEYMSKLKLLRCEFEAIKIKTSVGERILFGVDVPPQADIYKAYKILERGEKAGVWMFQEGHVGHTVQRG